MTTPTVAEQNKALIREIFAAAAAGDRTKYQDRIADDATFTVTGEHSWSQTFRGKESIGRRRDGIIVEMKEYQDSLMCDRILGPFPPEMRAMRP